MGAWYIFNLTVTFYPMYSNKCPWEGVVGCRGYSDSQVQIMTALKQIWANIRHFDVGAWLSMATFFP